MTPPKKKSARRRVATSRKKVQPKKRDALGRKRRAEWQRIEEYRKELARRGWPRQRDPRTGNHPLLAVILRVMKRLREAARLSFNAVHQLTNHARSGLRKFEDPDRGAGLNLFLWLADLYGERASTVLWLAEEEDARLRQG